jgi:hypothetical protein
MGENSWFLETSFLCVDGGDKDKFLFKKLFGASGILCYFIS